MNNFSINAREYSDLEFLEISCIIMQVQIATRSIFSKNSCNQKMIYIYWFFLLIINIVLDKFHKYICEISKSLSTSYFEVLKREFLIVVKLSTTEMLGIYNFLKVLIININNNFLYIFLRIISWMLKHFNDSR